MAEIWHFVVIQAVREAATAFFGPASTGLVPQVVGEEQLQQGNAILRLSMNASTIGGAAPERLSSSRFGCRAR